MDPDNGEEKKKIKRAKLNVEDLASRIIKSCAGEDYVKVCIENVFNRIQYETTLSGEIVVADADTFTSLPSKLAFNLKEMGITQLLPTQRYTLPLLVDHDTDVFVGASTGHGKTLAFLIPIVVSLLRQPSRSTTCGRPRALVVANTQVLQVQTYAVCKSLIAGTGLRAVLVCGETSVQQQQKEINREGVDIIIATTGRLKHFLNMRVLFLDDLQYFIYDEADKMTQRGAFQDEIIDINEMIPPETKINLRACFFTATLDAINGFDDMYRPDKFTIVRVPGNPLITHHIIPIDREQDNDDAKSSILMRLLLRDLNMQGRVQHDETNDPYLEKTIVFVKTKVKCNYLAAYLRSYGFSAGVMNSDLSLEMRNKIITRFSKGEMQALICTDSMARGHDIPHVTHVINYEISDLDTFKHRAGRTARIGHKGICTTLLSKQEFYLYPEQKIMFLQRQKAIQFAHYLVLECGQRVPECLVESVYDAMDLEFAKWGQANLDARVLVAELVKDRMEEEQKEIEEEMRKMQEANELRIARKEEKAAREAERKAKREKINQQPPITKMAELDDDGTPVFDASMTEQETEYTDDDEEEEDNDEDEEEEEGIDWGGVTIPEEEFNEKDYYCGDYPVDSDSDGPKAGGDDSEEEREKTLRWTDEEDEVENNEEKEDIDEKKEDVNEENKDINQEKEDINEKKEEIEEEEEEVKEEEEDIDSETEQIRMKAMLADYEKKRRETEDKDSDDEEEEDYKSELDSDDLEEEEVEVIVRPKRHEVIVNDDEVD